MIGSPAHGAREHGGGRRCEQCGHRPAGVSAALRGVPSCLGHRPSRPSRRPRGRPGCWSDRNWSSPSSWSPSLWSPRRRSWCGCWRRADGDARAHSCRGRPACRPRHDLVREGAGLGPQRGVLRCQLRQGGPTSALLPGLVLAAHAALPAAVMDDWTAEAVPGWPPARPPPRPGGRPSRRRSHRLAWCVDMSPTVGGKDEGNRGDHQERALIPGPIRSPSPPRPCGDQSTFPQRRLR